jgi:hypothetical protein
MNDEIEKILIINSMMSGRLLLLHMNDALKFLDLMELALKMIMHQNIE